MTRLDLKHLAAWQLCVEFNNFYPVGSYVELQIGTEKICGTITAQAFVLPNGVAYTVLDGRQIRLTDWIDASD